MIDSTIEKKLLDLSINTIFSLTDDEKISLIGKLWHEVIDCKDCPFRVECENDDKADECNIYVERKLLNAR